METFSSFILNWIPNNLAVVGMFVVFLFALATVIADELGGINLASHHLVRISLVRIALPASFWSLFFYALIPLFKNSGDFGPSFLEYSLWMPILTGLFIFVAGLAMHLIFLPSKERIWVKALYWLTVGFFAVVLVVLPVLAILTSLSSDPNALVGTGTAGARLASAATETASISPWSWLNQRVNSLISIFPGVADEDERFFVRGVLPFLMAFVIAIYISLDRFITELNLEPQLKKLTSQDGVESAKSGRSVFIQAVLPAVFVVVLAGSIMFLNFPLASLGIFPGTLLGQVHIATVMILGLPVILFVLSVADIVRVCTRCVARVTLGAASAVLVGRSGDQDRNEHASHGLLALLLLFVTFSTFILEHDQRFPGETFAIQRSAAALTGAAKVLYVTDEVVAALGGDIFDVYNLSVPGVFNIPTEFLTTDPDLIQLGFDFSEVTHQRQNFFLSLFVLAFRTALVGALLVTILGGSNLAKRNGSKS